MKNNYGFIEMYIDELIKIKELNEILIEIRESTGMNKKQFSEYFHIPYRTFQDWELGNRKIPIYLLKLIYYKIAMEELGKV